MLQILLMPWNHFTVYNDNIKPITNNKYLTNIILANKAFTGHFKRYYSDITVTQAFHPESQFCTNSDDLCYRIPIFNDEVPPLFK